MFQSYLSYAVFPGLKINCFEATERGGKDVFHSALNNQGPVK